MVIRVVASTILCGALTVAGGLWSTVVSVAFDNEAASKAEELSRAPWHLWVFAHNELMLALGLIVFLGGMVLMYKITKPHPKKA